MDKLILTCDPMKRCAHCKKILPVGYFYRCRAAKDTLQSWCKQCQKNYHSSHIPSGSRRINHTNRKTKQPMPIIGFENITEPLTEYEINSLLPRVAEILSHCVGKKNAIRNKTICDRLKREGFDSTKISEPRMRKIINVIRRTKNFVPFLIANSNGYYIAETKEEVECYAESLKERATAIFEVRQSLLDDLSGRLFV